MIPSENDFFSFGWKSGERPTLFLTWTYTLQKKKRGIERKEGGTASTSRLYQFFYKNREEGKTEIILLIKPSSTLQSLDLLSIPSLFFFLVSLPVKSFCKNLLLACTSFFFVPASPWLACTWVGTRGSGLHIILFNFALSLFFKLMWGRGFGADERPLR